MNLKVNRMKILVLLSLPALVIPLSLLMSGRMSLGLGWRIPLASGALALTAAGFLLFFRSEESPVLLRKEKFYLWLSLAISLAGAPLLWMVSHRFAQGSVIGLASMLLAGGWSQTVVEWGYSAYRGLGKVLSVVSVAAGIGLFVVYSAFQSSEALLKSWFAQGYVGYGALAFGVGAVSGYRQARKKRIGEGDVGASE